VSAADVEPGQTPPPYAGVEREYLWRQYNLWIELYKFHMKLVMEAVGFYFLVTGAMLTFAYAPQREKVMVPIVLLLPALMGFGIAGICCYGAFLTGDHRRDIHALADQLGFAVTPDSNFMRVTCWASAAICIITSIGLLVFIRMDPSAPW
jgi:hypothetical protein